MPTCRVGAGALPASVWYEAPMLTTLRPSAPSTQEFLVYRWDNPETDCEYPYLLAPDDRSVLLSVGNYSLCLDLDLLPETEQWLSNDYVCTGERLTLDLSDVLYLLDSTFAGGALFGVVKFDSALAISELQLSLRRQEAIDSGPEYLVHKLGDYVRWYRQTDRQVAVTMAERAMLDVYCSTVEAFAAEARDLLIEEPPPRYRSGSGSLPS